MRADEAITSTRPNAIRFPRRSRETLARRRAYPQSDGTGEDIESAPDRPSFGPGWPAERFSRPARYPDPPPRNPDCHRDFASFKHGETRASLLSPCIVTYEVPFRNTLFSKMVGTVRFELTIQISV